MKKKSNNKRMECSIKSFDKLIYANIKKIRIEDISLLIPIALFSFNGIAINSVPELGYDPKILLILRYEIW